MIISEIQEKSFVCKRDNLTIKGTEYRCDGDNLPIAIVCHGLMTSLVAVRRYAHFLAELGYAAYCFDFCGGCAIGRSDGKTTNMSISSEIEDLKKVIEYARSIYKNNRDDVLLMGCSQGGLVASLTAVELPFVSKLILLYPAFSLPYEALNGVFLGFKFNPNELPENIRYGFNKLSKNYLINLMTFDPYKEIKKYSGDVLIIHGTDDTVIDISYSEKAFQILRDQEINNRKLEFYPIANGGHGFWGIYDKKVVDHIENFIKE